jgi:hypothetical protein
LGLVRPLDRLRVVSEIEPQAHYKWEEIVVEENFSLTYSKDQ